MGEFVGGAEPKFEGAVYRTAVVKIDGSDAALDRIVETVRII